jgi:hypothetical protein
MKGFLYFPPHLGCVKSQIHCIAAQTRVWGFSPLWLTGRLVIGADTIHPEEYHGSTCLKYVTDKTDRCTTSWLADYKLSNPIWQMSLGINGQLLQMLVTAQNLEE